MKNDALAMTLYDRFTPKRRPRDNPTKALTNFGAKVEIQVSKRLMAFLRFLIQGTTRRIYKNVLNTVVVESYLEK